MKSIIKLLSTRGSIQITIDDEITEHEARELCDAVTQTIRAQYEQPKLILRDEEKINLERKPPTIDLDQVQISVDTDGTDVDPLEIGEPESEEEY